VDIKESLMTVEDVAKYLKLKPQTIYKWAQDGTIPAIKLGKEWRFRLSIIDKWLDQKFLESPAMLAMNNKSEEK